MEYGFVEVKFLNGHPKGYFFKNGHEGIMVGDTVAVDTQYGLQLAKVIDKPESVHRNVRNWVAGKLDLSRFEEIRYIREKEKAVKVRKMQLKNELKKRFEAVAMPEVLEQYAEKDPELAEMLKEYNSL